MMGMGNLGGPEKVHVPEPSQNYTATIIDQTGVSTDVEMLSFGGFTAVSGKVGSAQVSVDFDKIDTIQFLKQGKDLTARLTLQDGDSLSMTVDNKGLTCYARLPYGGYKIDIEDIRSIDIKGRVTNE
jgi:hypothetical protein